jgi:hypothetical protein
MNNEFHELARVLNPKSSPIGKLYLVRYAEYRTDLQAKTEQL